MSDLDKGGENLIRVYIIKDMLGMGQGPTFYSLGELFGEIREYLGDEHKGQITIEISEMTESAYLQIPEFEGY